MKLRDYELRAVNALPRLLRKHKRVCAVAPTGSGKTVIAAALINKKSRTRVLWVAHRRELIDQAVAQLVAAGIPAKWIGVLAGHRKENLEKARVIVSSVGMFGHRDVPDVDLIVVDECHRIMAASYLEILAAVPDALVLGLTATPWRLDGQGLGDVFNHLYVMAGQTELIVDGYIMQPRTYGIPKEKARDILRGVSGGKEFAQGALGRAMMKGTLMGDVVSECARLAPGKLTLVFAVNREHGKALAKRFKRARCRTAYLDGDTDDEEREAIVAGMRDGSIEVVVNVDVLSEGFDCPTVKCIALCRPTKSLTRFLQQIGRASRPQGGRPIVLDHAGNVWRHGLPESEHDWTLDGRPRGDGREVVKQCVRYPRCDAMMAVNTFECPECGAEQPRAERERELLEQAAELQRLKANEATIVAARERLEKIAKEKNAPKRWVDRVIAEMFRAA